MLTPPSSAPPLAFTEKEAVGLSQLVEALHKCSGLSAVCETLATRLLELAALDDCVVYVRHENLLVQSAAAGDESRMNASEALLGRVAQPLGSGIAGRAALHRTPVYLDDPHYGAEGCRSEYAVPMIHKGELIGVIDSLRVKSEGLDASCKTLMRTVADVAATAVASQLNLDRDTVSNREDGRGETQQLDAVARLAARVAHDFNNLLTVINGSASLLLKRQTAALAGPDDSRFLRMIQQAGERAQKLTRQLSTFGKEQRLNMQVVDAWELMGRGLRLGQGALREDIEVVFEKSDQPCWVECDSDLLEQAISNLLSNAVDATPIGGRIRLAVLQQADTVICRVEDSGAGVAEPLRHRMFEPFFTTKQHHDGGLGLSVAYGVVKQHGGELRLGIRPKTDKDAEAQDDYGGAVFEICLPMATAPAFPSGDIRVTEPNGRKQIGGRVLLLESEDELRSVLERMLTRLGFEAVVASDSGDALRLVRERNISVLVTDVVMLDMQGAELYELALKQNPELKVLYVSSYPESSYPEPDLSSMPDQESSTRYLSRPFSLQSLESSLYDLFQTESERSPVVVEPLTL